MKVKLSILKITIFIIFIFISFLCVNISVNAFYDQKIYQLSNLSEDECFQFIIDNKVTIPESLKNIEELKTIVKNIITITENSPTYNFAFNFSETKLFADEIQKVVNDYYNNKGVNSYKSIELETRNNYLLKNSYVYGGGEWKSYGGEWKEKWSNYNCYAYAIGRTESNKHYETRIQYDPGDFSTKELFNPEESVDLVVSNVVSDLQALGFSNISVSDTYNYNDLGVNDRLICVRKSNIDYHFMRYDQISQKWYHKPSLTAVLQYKYDPDNELLWTNENSKQGVEREGFIYYESNIKFIMYTAPTIALSDICTNVSKSIVLESEMDIIYDLNMEFSIPIEIEICSLFQTEVNIYDNDMNILETHFSNFGNGYYYNNFIVDLNTETFYLRLCYVSPYDSGHININASLPVNGVVSDGITNILDFYLYEENCILAYIPNKSGMYDFSINGTLLSEYIVYMCGCLGVYSDYACLSVIKRMETSLYDLNAVTSNNCNNLAVYLQSGNTYYIKIDLDLSNNNISSLYMNINIINDMEEVDIGLSNTYDIMTNETKLGDNFIITFLFPIYFTCHFHGIIEHYISRLIFVVQIFFYSLGRYKLSAVYLSVVNVRAHFAYPFYLCDHY